jgi:two-component system cell cycle sensor histidine kinase/response regulator CckA
MSEAINVLLIDDDEDDYTLTRELFSLVKTGKYALDWAPSYEEGLTVAARGEHRVCLVDYHLGEHNGVQLIREARERRLTTPMILLTGAGDHDVDVEAMQAGATDYLVKDETSPARLERTIRYAVQLNAERCRAEAEIRRSEARFRRVVESNMLGIIFWAGSGQITDANEAFLDMVGYTREDLAADRVEWTKMTPPEYRQMDEHFLQELAASGVCATYEKEVIRKDGVRISILMGGASNLEVEEQSGVAFVLNISDRKKAEESLRRSESRFRALFENALDAVLISDDLGAYVDANPAACKLLGMFHDDVIGRKLSDFTDSIPYAPGFLSQQQFIEDGATSRLFPLRRMDGTIVEVDSTTTANFLPGRHLSLLRDVTERRKLEEQLRQSQRLESVGMLAGGIAHDFNNLLTVIAGYADITLKRLDKSDPLALYLEEINKAADRAASLTRQLLAFSRKQVLQPKVLDLNSVIANIEKMLRRLVGEDMELRTSMAPELGKVKADPGQIEQVIMNLAVNARDAMPKGGKITIETANIYLDAEYARQHIGVKPGWYVMLVVSDNGHGMDAETQKSIFEPFFSTKPVGKGTGLGLATVYGIVKQSSGNIWVYSEVGVGSSFKIYLPPVEGEIAESPAVVTRPEARARTETILLAEDEEMVRNLARDSLKLYGYQVLDAASAGEAMLIAKEHDGPIHLLLTDVVMPRISGKELAERVGSLRPDMRVLYMSGYTDQSIVHHGVLDEGIAFLGKPFTPDALALKVAEVLGVSRLS